MTLEPNDERIAEILAEYQESRERGAAADPAEILRANPDLADELAAHFAAQAIFDDLVARATASAAGAPSALGEFRILREIGRGGMGVVYEAEQTPMRRRVALKVLFPAITSSRSAVERFQREARAAGRLHHTNIVPVYSMGEERGVWFYAMELVAGRPLDAVIDDVRRLSRPPRGRTRPGATTSAFGTDPGTRDHFKRVALAFAGVAEGLHAAHAAGIVHRDVKPSNLVLDADGTLRLMDFGLARIADEVAATRTGEIVGTPAYMSPEQVGGVAGPLDARTDVYSLGATLYEALTLQSPVRARAIPELLAAIRTQEPVRPRRLDARIPRDLETIVLKALEKDPARRYATAADMAADLHAFAAEAPVRARRITALGRAWRTAKRHKLVTTLTAASLVMAGALVALGVHAAHEAEHRRLHDYQRLCVVAAEEFASAQVSMDIGRLFVADSAAREALTQAIELDPSRADAWLWRALVPGAETDARLADVDAAAARGLSERTRRLARAHVLAGADRAGESEAELGLAGAPPAARTGLDAYFEGHLTLLKGRPKEAVALLGEALASAPAGSLVQTLARRSRAAAREAAGDLAGAIDDLASLRGGAGAPGPGPRIRIAQLWSRLGQKERSERVLEELLEEWRRSTSAEQWVALTMSLHNSGLHEFADRVTAAALAAFPDHPWLLHNRAAALFQAGRLEEALPIARRAAELRPEDGRWLSFVGKILVHLTRNDEAEDVLRRAVALDPDSVTVRLNLAALHRSAARWDEALAEVRRAIELDATSHVVLESLSVALIGPKADFRGLGDAGGARVRPLEAPGADRCLAEALEVIERALALAPRCTACSVNRALTLHHLGRDAEGLAALDRILEPRAKDSYYWGVRAETLAALERFDEALSSFDRAIEAEQDSKFAVGWLSHRAELLLRLDRGDEADAQWQRIEELLPGNALAVSAHGEMLLQLGRPADALAAYERALAIEPSRFASRIGRANALVALRRPADALTELDGILAAEPSSAMARYNRAWVRSTVGRFDDALADYALAQQADPNLWQAFQGEGLVRYQRREFAEALRAFDRGLAVHPENLGLLLNRAGALEALDRPADALETLERAAKIGTPSASTVLHIGLNLSRLHRDDEALRAFERALQLDPKEPISRNSVAWMLATNADPAARDPARAVHLAREAVALVPQEPSFVNTLGIALCAKGEWKEARDVLVRSMARRSGGDAYDWFPAAIAAKHLGDDGQAREWFDKAVAWMAAHDPHDAGLDTLRRDAAEALGVPVASPAAAPAGE